MVPMLPDRDATYDKRTSLWMQRWSWSREFMAEAAKRNTLPAVVVRGAAVAAFQAAFYASAVLYGLAVALAIVGAY